MLVNDAGDIVSSLMNVQGGMSSYKIKIGRNIDWGTMGNVDINETVT